MTVEDIKRDSDHLRGSLVAELGQDTTLFEDASVQLLKFHGVYQQDDRDLRRGAEREYVMMVRASVPGGVLSGEQYLVADGLADWVGNGTLRVTSRQGLQWHQVRKGSLRPLIWTLNQSLVTTLGACGDVVRNVVACPAPTPDRQRIDLTGWAGRIASLFRPRTAAYYEVWIDGARTITAHPPEDAPEEPIYGDTYLPRKFKIGVAAPGDNCVDVYTHDVGLVPVVHDGRLTGFTVLVGGGQGQSHGQPETYPRLADPLTTVTPDQVLDVVEAVVVTQRDHGNREDRKQARLKYLIDRWGLPRFRSEVEDHLGQRLPDAEATEAMTHVDHLGWHRAADESWWLGVHIENGRIGDSTDLQLRTGLVTVVDRFRPEVRFTPQQNLLLCGISDEDRAEIERILDEHKVTPAARLTPVLRDAMACVALPTCGLALTDAERTLPKVIRDIDAVLHEMGLETDDFGVRMTGCPNGCARPYSTEIGLVGHRRDRYDIHVGGARDGTRLNQLLLESVRAGSIAETLRPVFAAYASGRQRGESFGDFTHRLGVERIRQDLLTSESAR